MSDPIDPDDLPLSHAEACRDPRLAPGGKPISLGHYMRLNTKGKKAKNGQTVKLEFVIAGRGRATTRRKIAEFYARLNQPSLPPLLAGSQPASALPSHSEAERQLDVMGVR